jgi:hypothetical protein
MENCKKDYKSLVNRRELQIRTSALNCFGANPEERRLLLDGITPLLGQADPLNIKL